MTSNSCTFYLIQLIYFYKQEITTDQPKHIFFNHFSIFSVRFVQNHKGSFSIHIWFSNCLSWCCYYLFLICISFSSVEFNLTDFNRWIISYINRFIQIYRFYRYRFYRTDLQFLNWYCGNCSFTVTSFIFAPIYHKHI